MPDKKITPALQEMAEEQLHRLQRQIDYDTRDYPLDVLLTKYKQGDFFIPAYQRQYIWKPRNRSSFIESVLLGLPIPFMFFAGCQDGRFEIIDGVQRIKTLHEFVHGDLQLSNLPKLTQLDCFRFSDLSEATKRRFLNCTFRIIVLAEDTPSDVRQDLFNRINTSGVRASDSEIRRGSYVGRLTTFIEKCCKDKRFRDLCPIPKEKENRQERFELLLRFFAYLYQYQEFVHDVNKFLDAFLEKHLNSFDESLYKADFDNMLTFVQNHFPFGFGKTKNATTTPRVRFEAIAVGVALALKVDPNLNVNNVDWLNSNEFKEHTTSDASNNQGKLKGRVEYVRDQLLRSAI